MLRSLVGSEMCIRDRVSTQSTGSRFGSMAALSLLQNNPGRELYSRPAASAGDQSSSTLFQLGAVRDVEQHRLSLLDGVRGGAGCGVEG
eukprot:TRINITY_DN5796_c0_g4_i3.p1 TRINITY_DN5796_c0_g4~~TRINITY_DN5796_c0_g4_i3.p1  ORF type:complete len:104 (-),score=40.80 TRINITY_DN5796_c0_g4_i3:728-994(-)